MSKSTTRSRITVGLLLLALALVPSFAWLLSNVSASADDSPAGVNTYQLSTESENIRVFAVSANDIVFNPSDQTIYASVPSSAGSTGNSIRSIDPRTGETGEPVYVGSEPTRLAMANDGQSLYVALDGAFAVGRFNTVTKTAGAQFSTSYGGDGRYRVADLAVSPDDPNMVAVARVNVNLSPPGEGIAIFSNGTALSLTTPGHNNGSDSLAFSGSGTTLYGTGMYHGLKKISVNGSGAAVETSTTLASGTKIKFSGGKVFSSGGHVADAATSASLGIFPGGLNTAAFVPDTSVGRAYYLVKDTTTTDTWILKAYNIDTFTLAGTLNITGVSGTAGSLIRWGGNGLAFRTTGGQLFVLQTDLIPSGEPIPTSTGTPIPLPTPTPMTFATRIDQIPVYGNDLVYNPADSKLYTSVPGNMGSTGNSIATILPETAAIESTVYIGSEPNKLALASDHQKLFVGLDGSRMIHEFDTASQTGGTQFSAGVSSTEGPWMIADIAVSPDDPNQLAVVRRSGATTAHGGDAVFDSGVQRSGVRGKSESITFGANSSTLYGMSDQGLLEIMPADASGLTSITQVPIDAGSGAYFNKYLKYYNGLLYGPRGRVIDPVTKNLAGTYSVDSLTSTPIFAIDGEHNRIFYLVKNSDGTTQVRAFELDTFRPAGSIYIPVTGTPTDIERWGTNGLAISQSDGPVLLVRSTLIDTNTPVVPASPTPTPTLTPVSTPPSLFVRRVNLLNNDMVFNPGDKNFYISVPGAATDGTGNTVTRIAPATGEVVSSVFVGSEPTKLGMADDEQTLYVGLNGPKAVRRFDTSSQTAGLQFSIAAGSSALDLAAVPGNPDLVVVSSGSSGTAIYENGVKRPAGLNSSNMGPVEFSTADTFYGYDNLSSGSTLYKVGVNTNGLNSISSVRNLISGYNGLADMKFVEGKIYTATGRVVNPATNLITGTFSGPAGDSIAVDTLLRKVFIASPGVINVYDMDSYLKIGTITYPGSTSGKTPGLIRWGVNGLAMRVYINSTQQHLLFIQSPLVSPAAPVPAGFNLDAAAYSTSENAATRTVSVTRSGEMNTAVTVKYETIDDTANAGSDYIAASGTLSFAPGETVKTFDVQIINDNVFEANETFKVKIKEPAGVAVTMLTPTIATVTLSDNDSRPTVSDEGTSVDETSSGNTSVANVFVRLTNPSTETISVNYDTANGTATSGDDYQATSGVLTFAPLETVRTIPVTVFGDNDPEGNETFFVNLSNPVNTTIATGQAIVNIVDLVVPAHKAAFDFDGDGRSDISVFRPSEGNWYIQQSTAGYTGTHFGITTDKLVPADYDADGKTDVAVFRDGAWYLMGSTSGFRAYTFGQAGDIPQPADFNGDGQAELAVFRPSDGGWYKLDLNGNVFTAVTFGTNGDKPVVGDYDGDGKADPAVYRGGAWYILGSTQGYYGVNFGIATDKVVPADYDGDGKTDQAVVRDGFWYLLQSTAGYTGFQWGLSTDTPVAADYDGDGKTDVSVYRDGQWYLLQSTAGYAGANFGLATDKPVPNAFVQ